MSALISPVTCLLMVLESEIHYRGSDHHRRANPEAGPVISAETHGSAYARDGSEALERDNE